MREYSKYVNNKYQEWTTKYDIPEHMEFELKTMFELEEQFQNQPPENVKTKRDILEMITKISGRFSGKLFEKKKSNKIKQEIIIAVNSNSKELFNLIRELESENISKLIDSIGYKEITIGECILKLIEKDNLTDRARGIRCNYYINLTGDNYFEDTVLKTMLYSHLRINY